MEDKCWSDPINASTDSPHAVSFYLPTLPLSLPRLQVQQQEELPSNSSSFSSSSRDSTHSPPYQRTQNLRDIYELNNVIDEQVQNALFSYQPTYFEEAVKEEKWVETMNEEIDAIERNQT